MLHNSCQNNTSEHEFCNIEAELSCLQCYTLTVVWIRLLYRLQLFVQLIALLFLLVSSRIHVAKVIISAETSKHFASFFLHAPAAQCGDETGRCHDLTNQCAPPLQIMKYTNEHAVTAGISFSDRWSECGVAFPPSTDTHRHKAPRLLSFSRGTAEGDKYFYSEIVGCISSYFIQPRAMQMRNAVIPINTTNAIVKSFKFQFFSSSTINTVFFSTRILRFS